MTARLLKPKPVTVVCEDGAELPGWTRHSAHHLSMVLAGDRLDFWPSTSRWRWRGKTYRTRWDDLAAFIAAHKDDASPTSAEVLE